MTPDGICDEVPYDCRCAPLFHGGSRPEPQDFHGYLRTIQSSYYEIFQLENSAAVANDALQLTTDYKANYSTLLNPPLENQSGRVMLKQRFKLWERGYNETSDRVASFNSSFLFSHRARSTTSVYRTNAIGSSDWGAAIGSSPSHCPHLTCVGSTSSKSPPNTTKNGEQQAQLVYPPLPLQFHTIWERER
ncbi:hypothetical protein RHMOL_Rhmol08G0168600 [Rhododendron molle]|uniref:Uncharacterized protein n=1 Tax=Rhododendron molle TaxID=49168 RepID=A0ACC0MR85_RHOML|nr:hypothetical protein RHMOL_Rhmol08G0168600 [Rhododendron molle]